MRDDGGRIPGEWHRGKPLDVAAPRSWRTALKLNRALATPATCIAALGTGAEFVAMPPRGDRRCGIDPRVSLSRLGLVTVDPVETTCTVALRAAMWERHALRPAAETLGSPVARLFHQGSYICRPIRDGGDRLSTHATAEAIDLRGVELSDGR